MAELKLPEHILVREGESLLVRERDSGRERLLITPVTVDVRVQRSGARYVAGLACGLLAIYFSYAFLPRAFSGVTGLAGLLLLMALPFFFGKLLGGRIALLSYIVGFLSFAALRGALANGELRLGVIFFGGGPGSYTGYSIVPSSDIFVAFFLGLLPYAIVTMVGQVLVRLDVVLKPGGDEEGCVISLRRSELAREVRSFVDGDEGSRT